MNGEELDHARQLHFFPRKIEEETGRKNQVKFDIHLTAVMDHWALLAPTALLPPTLPNAPTPFVRVYENPRSNQ